MGTSGHILTDINKFDPVKCIQDIKTAIAKAGLFTRNEGKFTYDDEGKLVDFETNIFDETAFNYDYHSNAPDEGEEIILYADSVETANNYEWISGNEKINKLYRVIYLEEIINREKTLFQFTYEYLKLNPNDCLWVEDDWVYTLNDMEKLKQRPFDPDWCYKDPRNL